MAKFNQNWTPDAYAYYSAGGTPDELGKRFNAAGAFSGIDGLKSAETDGSGHYDLIRYNGDDRYSANATTQGDKANVGAWKYNPLTSDLDMAIQAAALAAAAYGGLSAGGFLGGAGAGAGAGVGALGEAAAAPGLGITEAGLAGAAEGAAGMSGISAGGGLSGATGAGTVGSAVTGALNSAPLTFMGESIGAGSFGSGLDAAVNGGGLFSGMGDKALSFVRNNPRLVSGLLGGASGAAGGGVTGGYTGPMPTITQGNWKPSVQQQSMPLTDVSTLTKMPKKGLQGSGLFRFMG